ncbi:MAG: hypothetical protein EOO03_12365, partial [Chitinophagaceae bacterium]
MNRSPNYFSGKLQQAGRFHRCVIRYLVLFNLLLLTSAAVAQEFSFNQLTLKDGLASNKVHSVWQDAKGFLWIGTDDGLQRYDGYNFFTPRLQAAANLPVKGVEQVMGDKKGRMFIRMKNEIGIFDGGTFVYKETPLRLAPSLLQGREVRLETDARGNVYVLVNTLTWLYFNEKTGVFEEAAAPFQLPYNWQVRKVVEDTVTGRYWIAGLKGLAYYDIAHKQIYSKGNNPGAHKLLDAGLTHLAEFYIDSKRRHWILNWDKEQQFYCFDEKQNRFTADTAGYGHFYKDGYFEVHRITEVADKKIIVAYGFNNLFYKKEGSFIAAPNHLENTYSIQYGEVNQVFQDREKIIWLATDYGLYNSMLNLHNNTHMVLPRDEPANITGLLEQANGDILVGTWGKGLRSRNAGMDGPGSLPPLPTTDGRYQMIWDFCEQPGSGNVWIGCQEGRLMIYEPAAKKYHLLIPPQFSNSTIRRIDRDSTGNIWLGLNNGSLFKWDAKTPLSNPRFIECYKVIGRVIDMYVDHGGLLWLSTHSSGTIVFDPVLNKEVARYTKNSKHTRLSSDETTTAIQINDS